MRENHPAIWYDLVNLGKEKHIISTLFNRTEKITEIEERLKWGSNQISMFD